MSLKNLFKKGSKENKPVFVSIKKGDLKFLKQCYRRLLNRSRNLSGEYPIHYAIRQKKLNIVSFLLDQRVDLSFKNAQNITPQNYAVKSHNVKINKLFIEKVEMNKTQKVRSHELHGEFGLHLAIIENNFPLMKLYLESKWRKDHGGQTSLHYAAKLGRDKFLKYFFKKGEKLCGFSKDFMLWEIENKDFRGNNSIHLACKNGHFAAVKLLVEQYFERKKVKKLPTCFNAKWESYYELAKKRNHKKVMKYLINVGKVNLNEEKREKKDQKEIVEFEESFMSMKFEEKYEFEKDKFFEAVKNDDLDYIREGKGNLNEYQDKSGDSPLFLAVKKNNPILIRLLLTKGAPVVVCDKVGRTPVHYACMDSTFECVRSLVDFMDFEDLHGRIPFHLACKKGRYEIVKFFLERGFNTLSYSTGRTGFHVCAKYGYLDILQLWVEKFDGKKQVLLKDKKGNNSLHFACHKHGNIETFMFLLNIKKEIELNDSTGKTGVVSFDFAKKGDDELNVKKGDLINVVKVESKDWVLCHNLSTNEKGIIPSDHYVLKEFCANAEKLFPLDIAVKSGKKEIVEFIKSGSVSPNEKKNIAKRKKERENLNNKERIENKKEKVRITKQEIERIKKEKIERKRQMEVERKRMERMREKQNNQDKEEMLKLENEMEEERKKIEEIIKENRKELEKKMSFKSLKEQEKKEKMKRAPSPGTNLKEKIGKKANLMMKLIKSKIDSKKKEDKLIHLEIDKRDLLFERLLGRGSFGIVYKAKWVNQGGGIACCVKEFDIVSEDMIKNEILTLSSVNFPHVCQIYGFTKDDRGKYSIVYEFIEGGSLFNLLHPKIAHIEGAISSSEYALDGVKRLSWIQKWFIIKQIVLAINYLHTGKKVKIIHGDIKSTNILLMKNLDIKLCDFFMSKIKEATGDTRNEENFKIKKSQFGGIRWKAPESIGKQGIQSEKSDIFSTGMTVYEILEEKVPYSREYDDVSIAFLIRDGELPVVNESAPQVMKELFFSSTKFNPEDRHSSKQLLEYIEEKESIFMKKFVIVKHLCEEITESAFSLLSLLKISKFDLIEDILLNLYKFAVDYNMKIINPKIVSIHLITLFSEKHLYIFNDLKKRIKVLILKTLSRYLDLYLIQNIRKKKTVDKNFQSDIIALMKTLNSLEKTKEMSYEINFIQEACKNLKTNESHVCTIINACFALKKVGANAKTLFEQIKKIPKKWYVRACILRNQIYFMMGEESKEANSELLQVLESIDVVKNSNINYSCIQTLIDVMGLYSLDERKVKEVAFGKLKKFLGVIKEMDKLIEKVKEPSAHKD